MALLNSHPHLPHRRHTLRNLSLQPAYTVTMPVPAMTVTPSSPVMQQRQVHILAGSKSENDLSTDFESEWRVVAGNTAAFPLVIGGHHEHEDGRNSISSSPLPMYGGGGGDEQHLISLSYVENRLLHAIDQADISHQSSHMDLHISDHDDDPERIGTPEDGRSCPPRMFSAPSPLNFEDVRAAEVLKSTDVQSPTAKKGQVFTFDELNPLPRTGTVWKVLSPPVEFSDPPSEALCEMTSTERHRTLADRTNLESRFGAVSSSESFFERKADALTAKYMESTGQQSRPQQQPPNRPSDMLSMDSRQYLERHKLVRTSENNRVLDAERIRSLPKLL